MFICCYPALYQTQLFRKYISQVPLTDLRQPYLLSYYLLALLYETPVKGYMRKSGKDWTEQC